ALMTLKEANVLALPVRGHNGGLENKSELWSSLKAKMKNQDTENKFEKVHELFPKKIDLNSLSLPSYLQNGTEKERRQRLEFFLRMVFSALVDADFLDTESHFSSKHFALRGDYPDLPDLWEEFEFNQSRLMRGAESTKLNQVRNSIYRQCLNAADQQQGFYSLTVPTGGGKTRSGMGFALQHAINHKLDRVIVVIPYTSIIEQTADTYREIFSQDRAVLEHHSGVLPSNYSEEYSRWWELAAENWDAPIVVTTSVQFFDSLYANKPAKCRKLHNVANSVVVLDEVQTLPEGRLEPILAGLKELVENYNTTVVFSTATQPAFSSKFKESINDRLDLSEVEEIIEEPQELFSRLKRVRYNTGGEKEAIQNLSWEEVATRMAGEKQAMAVTNTREDARRLYEELQAKSKSEGLFHLSSNLCGAHRREVLSEVKKKLSSGKDCLLATTQVVEAGVDIDFPTVLRAVGPLDRIVQAAGRCNREGRLKRGEVTIFEPKEGGMPPGPYKSGADTTRAMLAILNPEKLHCPRTYAEYFSKLYQAVDVDAGDIQKKREGLRYEDVADEFKLIEQDTRSVAVPWREKGEMLLNKIERMPEELIGRGVQRDLQPYLVDLYPHQFAKAESQRLCKEVAPNLWRWEGAYHERLGLTLSPPDKRSLLVT
ncbi:MAG: CRISPR-associated helicase Cas3', partial [Candidatus Acetothermia bacterium]